MFCRDSHSSRVGKFMLAPSPVVYPGHAGTLSRLLHCYVLASAHKLELPLAVVHVYGRMRCLGAFTFHFGFDIPLHLVAHLRP